MDELLRTHRALNILSLEDSDQDFEIVRKQLIDAGYNSKIFRVDNESEFASSLRNNHYDIILADFKLPSFDTFGALRLRDEICPTVPLICLSGAIGEEMAVKILKAGAVDYVLKDRPERLPFAIQNAIIEAKGKENLWLIEEALRESEAKYRGLFNGVGEAIYVQDREGYFLDVNTSAERMYGYSRETLIGKTPIFVAAPYRNDMEELGKMIERAFVGEPQRFEFWGKRANGEIFPKEVRLVRGTYSGKDVIIASADDITERKQAEDDLRESEIRLLHAKTFARFGNWRLSIDD